MRACLLAFVAFSYVRAHGVMCVRCELCCVCVEGTLQNSYRKAEEAYGTYRSISFVFIRKAAARRSSCPATCASKYTGIPALIILVRRRKILYRSLSWLFIKLCKASQLKTMPSTAVVVTWLNKVCILPRQAGVGAR